MSYSNKVIWALVDCNNFYASCEKLFRPDLADRPVVVLSNNDGCIVARSAEAKALGIPMGEPEFKARALLRHHGVAVFSSNYALYGDLSARVMGTLEQCCPNVEQYSIDEAFLRLDAPLQANLPEFCRDLRAKVLRWTGITVSVGVATTRTLAKIANHIAKAHKEYCGAFSLVRAEVDIDRVLAHTPVDEVWGIGRRQARKLRAQAIHTALDLKRADDIWLRRVLTITGWHTSLELRGIPCIGESDTPVARKTLVSSRSFGSKVRDKESVAEALATYAARAGERLRGEGLVAGGIAAHIRTSRHGAGRRYDQTAYVPFQVPTADTADLIRAVRRALDSIFQEGFAYAKAGVMLYEIEDKDVRQCNLLQLATAAKGSRREALMGTMDKLNRRYGRRSVRFGAEGPKDAAWHVRRGRCSPRLTTDWAELAQAVCR